MIKLQKKSSNLSKNALRRWKISHKKTCKKHANAMQMDMPSEYEVENEKEVNKGRQPKVEEVAAYCTERNNKIDPQGFVDFYESKGWMIGKNKMKDWKAAVRTWEKRSKEDKKAGDSPNKWNQLDKEYAAKYGDMK
jgi:hypothetical protein